MSKETAQLLDAFDALPAEEKRTFLSAVLLRSRGASLNAANAPADAWEHQLAAMIRLFQDETDPQRAHEQWKRIETEVFGVAFDD